ERGVVTAKDRRGPVRHQSRAAEFVLVEEENPRRRYSSDLHPGPVDVLRARACLEVLLEQDVEASVEVERGRAACRLLDSPALSIIEVLLNEHPVLKHLGH